MATIINPITTVLLNREEFESGEFDRFPFQYILEESGVISHYSKMSAGRYILSQEAEIKGLATNKTAKAPESIIQPLAHNWLIPREFFYQIRQFFIDVMKASPSTSEAQVFIVWSNNDEEYRIIIPKQTVSAARVDYDLEDNLNPDDVVICDIHSHNNMGAFFSGTDNNDDKGNPWISGVFGKLSTNMEDVFRFNDGTGRNFPMTKEEVFDFGDDLVTPSEWLDKVSFVKPVVSKKPITNNWQNNLDHPLSKTSGAAPYQAYSSFGDLDEAADTSTWDSLLEGDPEGDLYDVVVDCIVDNSNLEAKAVLNAALEWLKDPKSVPTLTERESAAYTDLTWQITNVGDNVMSAKVIEQVLTSYN